MDVSSLAGRRARALGPASRLFHHRPLQLLRGEGVWLWDAEGRRYLDCYNNVAAVGHCHPRVVEAIAAQAARLNTHSRYLHEKVVSYAERLAATMPRDLSVCMFTCSGTEANDLAVRIARAVTGHRGAVVLEGAYHGNSTTVFNLSPEDCPPDELPPWVATVPAPDHYRGPAVDGGGTVSTAVEALAARGHRPALFISDNVFSSNGVLTPPPEYLQSAYRAMRAAGGLAVADEVQSGLYRLGEQAWAFEDSAVVPDIVTLGKPLGNGHPLAALVTTPAIAAAFARHYHYFNTFAGNPVSAAAGLAVLDVIDDEGVQRNVRETGAYLQRGLRDLAARCPLVGDVRGKGLFFGVELVRDRDPGKPAATEAVTLREHLRENGILLGVTGPLGNVVKIRPPLVFSRVNADRLLEALEEALKCAN